jgi:Domain of unknown function (DUF4872)/Butirosin biosynthesis protein H, N-terminal
MEMGDMKQAVEIAPFANCPALDGYHCQTNSLAKIFYHASHPLSEDMMLGLGAGMGFMYWQMHMGSENAVFIGGRGNTQNFFSDLGKRTGVEITEVTTSSAHKAQSALLEKLAKNEPVMLFADMGFLPWLDLPEDYHFGGHTFVVCGFDGGQTVLASDMDQKAAGLKKGFYSPITLEQLAQARSSSFNPFPPRNTWLEFDFTHVHDPAAEDILSAIKQTVASQLTPPIKNMGVKGLKHAAKEILKWPEMFPERALRMNLFSLYVYIEIGGTGGGCFRSMYARFLQEAMKIVGNTALEDASALLNKAGKLFTEVGLLFQDAQTMSDLDDKIRIASEHFAEIAKVEEKAYALLQEKLSS